MEMLSYEVRPEEARRCKEEYVIMRTLSTSATAHCTEEAEHKLCVELALHHKLMCTVTKHGNQLRIINRKGGYTDVQLPAEMCVHHLTSSTLYGNAHRALFYAVGTRTLAIVAPITLASGELTTDVRVVAVPAASHLGHSLEARTGTTRGPSLIAAVSGEADRVYVLGCERVYVVDEVAASIVSQFALPPRTVARPGCFDFYAREQLLLVPAKATCLDLISSRTRASMLVGLWEPHGESPPSFARFAQSYERGAVDEAGEVRIVTAARGNTELRYWTFSLATRRFTLRQDVLLNLASGPHAVGVAAGKEGVPVVASKDAPSTSSTGNVNLDGCSGSGGGTDADCNGYAISMTPGDEYVTLCSRSDCHLLVVRNNRTRFCAENVTMWRLPAPAIACAAYVGKFADSLLSQSALLELCVVVRSVDCITKCILGSDRDLAQSTSNTHAVSTTDAVVAWFDHGAEAVPPDTPRPPLPAPTPPQLRQPGQSGQTSFQVPYLYTSVSTTTSTAKDKACSTDALHSDVKRCGGANDTALAPLCSSEDTATDLTQQPPPPASSHSTSSAMGAATGMTPLTTVAVSMRGDHRSTHAISEAYAASILRQQAHKFCEQVHGIDASLTPVQKTASNTMCMLQSSSLRERARTNGLEFALRNKQRLPLLDATTNVLGTMAATALVAATAAEPGTMSESQRRLILAISSVMKEVEGSTANAASAALKALLQRQLRQSVERASVEMETLDAAGSALSNISTTDAAAQMRQIVSAATSRVLAAIKERHDSHQEIVVASEKETSALLSKAHGAHERLRKAVMEAKSEVDGAATLLTQLLRVRVQVPVDPDVLTARAVALAEREDWVGAFTVALEASDITVLLAFLQSKVCLDKNAIAKSPNTLTLPLFLSLCLQLTCELGAHEAAVPLRVQLLHDLYLEWDDTLKGMKLQSNKSDVHNASFHAVKRELTNVAAALTSVDAQLLDRRTRSKFRLVTKLIDALVQRG